MDTLKTFIKTMWKKLTNNLLLIFLITLGITCFVLFLGIASSPSVKGSACHAIGVLDAVFYALQMIVLNYAGPTDCSYWKSEEWEIAFNLLRIIVPSIAAIEAIELFAQNGKQEISRYRAFLRHDRIIIIGGGPQGRVIANEHVKIKDLRKIYMITLDSQSPEIVKLQDKGVTVFEGDASDPETLEKLSVHKSSLIYIVAGKDETNISILEAIKKIQVPNSVNKGSAEIKKCLIHIYDDLLTEKLTAGIGELFKDKLLEVRVFNSWKNGAGNLIDKHGPDVRSPVKCADDDKPHVLLIGFSWSGQKLLEQLARLGHFAFDNKVRVTLVAPDALNIKKKLLSIYPCLEDEGKSKSKWGEAISFIPVINLDFIDAPTDGISREIIEEKKNEQISVAYICLPDQESAIKSLYSVLQQYPNEDFKIILVTEGGNLNESGKLLDNERIEVFDTINEGLKLSKNEKCIGDFSEREAVITDLTYNMTEPLQQDSTRQKAMDKLESLCKSLSSYSDEEKWATLFKAWLKIEEWRRNSSRDAVRHLAIKQRYGLSPDQDISQLVRQELSRMEHRRWCAERLLSGWRYSKNRDNLKKLHPDLKPFEDLEPENQKKDEAIVTIGKLISMSRTKKS